MNPLGLVGIAGSGKDTAAKLLQIELAKKGEILKTYAFAEPLKKFCQDVFQLTEQQLHDRIEKEKIVKLQYDSDEFKFRFEQSFISLLSKYCDICEIKFSYFLSSINFYNNDIFEYFMSIFKQYELEQNVIVSFFRKMIDKKVIIYKISPRVIFQLVGTEFFRNHVDIDFWTKIAPKSDVIFTDVRFPNESNHIIENDGYLIKIVNSIQSESKKMGHVSESFVDKIECEYVINNSGNDIDQLIKEVENLVQEKLDV